MAVRVGVASGERVGSGSRRRAHRLSTRMKTERVAAVVDGSRHWLYFSCRMSRFDLLICARIRRKSSSGGRSHVSEAAASLAWLSSCVQSCIAISILEERLRCCCSLLAPAPPKPRAARSAAAAFWRAAAAVRCMPCR